ncbi:glycoside hydrolase family 99-like domain-containing protein [Sphingomonas silueang]|uniref:glycoside hydrolase family 99-like domain-containing protein n=1 Tax=Sphingomonas silueang TaxID=3156617 RepID=UPI0032B57FBF
MAKMLTGLFAATMATVGIQVVQSPSKPTPPVEAKDRRSAPSKIPTRESKAGMAIELGTYYFPGWHRDRFFNNRDTWAPIKPYIERRPLKGWYDDTKLSVLMKQANEMSDAGINFVVFDWYFENGRVQADKPLRNFLGLRGSAPRAALMWARHGNSPPTKVEEWRSIVKIWIDYAKSPKFYRIDGHPVVMIFDTGRMAREATLAGGSLNEWLSIANSAAKKHGLLSFYFVAGVWNDTDTTIASLPGTGFRALTSYNFKRRSAGHPEVHGYDEMDRLYQTIWPGLVSNAAKLPVILPLTTGWDRRPWGGSSDPRTDASVATPDQFTNHLQSARTLMQRTGVRRAVICCWNEYGEGSLLEPNMGQGTANLNAVKAVFK